MKINFSILSPNPISAVTRLAPTTARRVLLAMSIMIGGCPIASVVAWQSQGTIAAADDNDDKNQRHQDRFQRHPRIELSSTKLELLTGNIDNDRVRERFTECGRSLIGDPRSLSGDEITRLIGEKKSPVALPLPQVELAEKLTYENIARASLMLGTIYDCGNCNDIHDNVAGGVMISHDGLAVTNHHVLDQSHPGTLANFAMTFEGTARPIIEVLYANEQSDIALIRLGGDAPFYPVPLAAKPPLPLEPATVLSNPSRHFFVLTTGIVNRHVSFRGRQGPVSWTEITAEYAAGSSGSGVFGSRGELIGLVSQNVPIRRIVSADRPNRDRSMNNYIELTLRQCVTLQAIRNCFAE